MDERLFYLGFAVCHGIGPMRFGQLLAHFGSAKKAWESSVEELGEVLGEITLSKFDAFRKKQNVEKLAETLAEKEIGYVCLFEKEYPTLLKKIGSHPVILSETKRPFGEDSPESGDLTSKNRDSSPSVQNDTGKSTFAPPFLLFYKGNKDVLQNDKTVGVVGTRKITDYGREVTKTIVRDLVSRGAVVVSGLALGVDSVAHETTLSLGGATIAVLGSGVDICTPAEHQKLYVSILEKGGCIVSAVPPGEMPIKGSFPARNRIVAGLSQGIVVTEGAEDSGALITAGYAKEFGRGVFAVPGPITSLLSKGPHQLIQNGAKMIASGYDIMEHLNIVIPAKAGIQGGSRVKPGMTVKGDSEEETAVLLLLATGPLHFDDIARKIDKDSNTIGSLLSLMELKGTIRITSQGEYAVKF